MNENLRKRKADFLQYLEEELSVKPRKWWQQNTKEYIPTREMDSGQYNLPHNPEETIIRYDFKRALTMGALFLCVLPIYFLVTGEFSSKQLSPSFWMMALLMLFAVIFPLMQNDKKGMLIVFNREGFWTKKMPQLVAWEYLVASYIIKDDSGESTSYYLLLYYYDENTDEFVKTEFETACLTMSKEEISLAIEYWKVFHKDLARNNNAELMFG